MKQINENSETSSKKESRKVLIILLIVILIVAVIPSLYFYHQNQETQKLLNNPNAITKQESQALINKVGALIVLPSEDPTIATVSDKSKLKDQPFFKNAQNGDKVLIFTKAKKAILYRPSSNKIIEVSPLNISDTTQPSVTQAVSKIRIALYNGTATPGLASTVEAQLKAKLQNIDVVDKTNANNNNYAKTLVIDIQGNKAEDAKQLATLLNGEVSKLPAGETKPNADFLIIVGK